jgi:hypothetical protein
MVKIKTDHALNWIPKDYRQPKRHFVAARNSLSGQVIPARSQIPLSTKMIPVTHR